MERKKRDRERRKRGIDQRIGKNNLKHQESRKMFKEGKKPKFK